MQVIHRSLRFVVPGAELSAGGAKYQEPSLGSPGTPKKTTGSDAMRGMGCSGQRRAAIPSALRDCSGRAGALELRGKRETLWMLQFHFSCAHPAATRAVSTTQLTLCLKGNTAKAPHGAWCLNHTHFNQGRDKQICVNVFVKDLLSTTRCPCCQSGCARHFAVEAALKRRRQVLIINELNSVHVAVDPISNEGLTRSHQPCLYIYSGRQQIK